MEKSFSRVRSACVLLAALLLAVVSGSLVKFGEPKGARTVIYRVTVELFGADARTVERLVICPLEAGISEISGIKSLRSTSEPGSATLFVEGYPGCAPADFQNALSETVDRVEALFPPTAQKTRIVPLADGPRPVWSAALVSSNLSLDELRDRAEKDLRPVLENLEGAASVEVSGGLVREVQVVLDVEKTTDLGTGVSDGARAIQEMGTVGSAGNLGGSSGLRNLFVPGRFGSVGTFENTPLAQTGGGPVPLSAVGTANLGAREQSLVSRLNGEERVVISVFPAGDADLVKLSGELNHKLDEFFPSEMRFEVITDRGRDLETVLKRLVLALLIALGLVLLTGAVAVRRSRELSALVLSVCAGYLGTLGLWGWEGLPLDGTTLVIFAGFSAMVAELAVPRNLNGNRESMVVFGLLLVPLVWQDSLGTEIRIWAGAGVAVLALGLLFSFFVRPALGLPSKVQERSCGWSVQITRTGLRLGSWSANHPKIVLVGGCALVVLTFLPLVEKKEVGQGSREACLFAHVDFPSETSVATVDSRLAVLAKTVKGWAGVSQVGTVAKAGSGELFLRRDLSSSLGFPTGKDLEAAGNSVPGALLVVDQEAQISRGRIVFLGDDLQTLRTLARKAAGILGASDVHPRVLLNFKDPPRRVSVNLDQKKLAAAGWSAGGVGQELRWILSGPVAVKWIQSGREYDVRVRGSRPEGFSRSNLGSVPLAVSGVVSTLGTVSSVGEEPGENKIYHENRRRSVSLTVDPGTDSLGTLLDPLDLPPGYSVLVDPVDRGPRDFAPVFWGLSALGFGLVYFFLGARFQSPVWAARILAATVLPLAIPVMGALWAGAGPGTFSIGLALSAGSVFRMVIWGTSWPVSAISSLLAGLSLVFVGGEDPSALTLGLMTALTGPAGVLARFVFLPVFGGPEPRHRPLPEGSR